MCFISPRQPPHRAPLQLLIMSTKTRGRKKGGGRADAAAAPPLRLEQDDEPPAALAYGPPPASVAAGGGGSSSPLVALGKRLASPVVTAAKAVAAAAATAAAALPSIPEGEAALSQHSLDMEDAQREQQQQLPGTPRVLTGGGGGNLLLDGDDASLQRDAGGSGGSGSLAQRLAAGLFATPIAASRQQQPSAREQQQAHGPSAHECADDDSGEDAAPWVTAGGTWRASWRELLARTRLPAGCSAAACGAGAGLLLLLAVLLLQASAMRGQQAALLGQRQQVEAQAAALRQLRQQLRQTAAALGALPDGMRQLQRRASSCSSDVGRLASGHAALSSSVEALQLLARQLADNVSSMQPPPWSMPAGEAAAGGASKPAQTPGGAVQPPLLPGGMAQQVQQAVAAQLAAQLPALDLALADCGGRIAFVSPAASQALLAPPASPAGSATRAVANGLRQLLQGSTAPRAAVPAGASPPQLARLTSLLLRPASAAPGHTARRAAAAGGSVGCHLWLRVNAGAPAVLELQLPQLAAVRSVSLHCTAAAGTAGSVIPGGSCPGSVTVGLANSSSCSASGACSAAASAGQHTTSSGLGNSSSRTGDEALRPGSEGRSVFAPGARGEQLAVSLTADSYAPPSGPAAAVLRAVVPLVAAGAGGIASDRLVLVVHDSVAGAVAGGGQDIGGGEVCLHRISVQGSPAEPGAWC